MSLNRFLLLLIVFVSLTGESRPSSPPRRGLSITLCSLVLAAGGIWALSQRTLTERGWDLHFTRVDMADRGRLSAAEKDQLSSYDLEVREHREAPYVALFAGDPEPVARAGRFGIDRRARELGFEHWGFGMIGDVPAIEAQLGEDLAAIKIRLNPQNEAVCPDTSILRRFLQSLVDRVHGAFGEIRFEREKGFFASELMQKGGGLCFNKSIWVAQILRRAGIRAELKSGWAKGAPVTSLLGSHLWVELPDYDLALDPLYTNDLMTIGAHQKGYLNAYWGDAGIVVIE